MKFIEQIELGENYILVKMYCDDCKETHKIKYEGYNPKKNSTDDLEHENCPYCRERIEKHRNKYPIDFEEITAHSSFTQILGNKSDSYTPEERKRRWFRNGELLKQVSQSAWEMYFTDEESNETCFGCKHRITGESWCKWSELPCNYNPVLQNLGMACMGMGYNAQQQMNFNENQ